MLATLFVVIVVGLFLGGPSVGDSAMPRNVDALCDYIRRAFMWPLTAMSEKEQIYRHLALMDGVSLVAVNAKYVAKYGESLREAVLEEWQVVLWGEDWRQNLLDRLGELGL